MNAGLREKARTAFKARLDDAFLKRFEEDKLFTEGSVLDWENLNGTNEITVLDYNGMLVKFKINTTGNTEKFTLDNLFIYNKAHLQSLPSACKEVYDSEKNTLEDFLHIDYDCVYIIHDEDCDKYYVGQAKHGSWRIKDHLHESATGDIDKRIREGMKYTLRFIPLEGSGYRSLDALEAAFIAYYNSFYKNNGYNKTRGNNGPGDHSVTMELL